MLRIKKNVGTIKPFKLVMNIPVYINQFSSAQQNKKNHDETMLNCYLFNINLHKKIGGFLFDFEARF